MRTKWNRLARTAAIAALTFPLLSTGTCLRIAQTSAVNGFFDAVTPYLIEYARSELGLTNSGTSAGNQLIMQGG